MQSARINHLNLKINKDTKVRIRSGPYPSFVIRPNVGFKPTIPHKAEGILIDPVSQLNVPR